MRAFVRLLSMGSSRTSWTFVTAGPCDALIVDSASPDLQGPALLERAPAVAALGPSRTVPPGVEVLDWPLRAEQFESWLGRVQGRRERRSDDAPADGGHSVTARRYRLKRWPPDELLRGDAQRIRLATLLSRKPLAVPDLVRLSGLPLPQCQTFVQLLQGFGLLELQCGNPAGVAEPPQRPMAAGVIQSIRRRLGL